jgi:acetyl esterase/lipase
MDLLRDDALIYENILKENGVPTRLEVYPGIPHGGLDFLPMLSQSKKSLRDMKAGVEWLLSHKS